jgi:hypothetical protein
VATLLRPQRWGAQKPPAGATVLAGHPLAAGLIGYWSLAQGAGRTLRNAAPAAGPGVTTLVGSIDWRVGPQGPGLAFPGGSTNNYVTTPTWAALRAATITVAAYARATTNVSNLDFGRYAGDSTANLTGSIGWVGLWNRALLPAAVASLGAEPFALLAPPAPRLRYWGGVIAPGPQTMALWNQRRVVYAPTRLY